jgi:hypothetical protein
VNASVPIGPLASERIGQDERGLRFARCSASSSIVDFRLECHSASTLAGRVLYPPLLLAVLLQACA